MTLPALPVETSASATTSEPTAKTLQISSGSVWRTQALFKLVLELFDLRMGTCKILDLPWNISFAQVIVEGTGG